MLFFSCKHLILLNIYLCEGTEEEMNSFVALLMFDEHLGYGLEIWLN